jgi:hypothetical protein
VQAAGKKAGSRVSGYVDGSDPRKLAEQLFDDGLSLCTLESWSHCFLVPKP